MLQNVMGNLENSTRYDLQKLNLTKHEDLSLKKIPDSPGKKNLEDTFEKSKKQATLLLSKLDPAIMNMSRKIACGIRSR